jgi:hypothetical protein
VRRRRLRVEELLAHLRVRPGLLRRQVHRRRLRLRRCEVRLRLLFGGAELPGRDLCGRGARTVTTSRRERP